MDEGLLSVGLDVGTTSTQMVVSRLQVENRASGFAVPELEITRRELLYRSPVHLTPMCSQDRIDAEALRQLIEEEYRRAGIAREQVRTGAIIITGETSRKENARAVLEALSHLAGDFVVAAAGPDLESRLAARGSGAVDWSRDFEGTVVHLDIGGGTSNLAVIRRGKILDTGCINVGGRLIRFDPEERITYVSPVLRELTDLRPGDRITREAGGQLARTLAGVLEMALGLRPPEPVLSRLVTREGKLPDPELLREPLALSFSGGVADCIDTARPWKEYGDLGPLLGRAIRESRLCRMEYRLGRETIRATVIGAGCHSTQLSGSTVFYRNLTFPIRDLQTLVIAPGEEPLSRRIRRSLEACREPAVLALPEVSGGSYARLEALAEEIVRGIGERPCCLCLQQDMAKALGQCLALRLPRDRPILCLDRIALGEDSYLDVGKPLGPAVPVVVKTLILGKQQ